MGLKIRVKTIPHDKQRYDTAGDYWDNKDQKEIRVSDLGNPVYEFLLAMHEMTEAFLCEVHGIREEDISKFDTDKLKLDKDPYKFNPGCDPKALYHKEHMFAEKIEKMLAKEFNVDWKEYAKVFDKLEKK